MEDTRAHAELRRHVDRLHQGRLRVWSIVITVFGDAVVPRGGEVWLGLLRTVMQRLGVEAGTLGAAMSRLTADGWLQRTKRGRRSYYRLREAGHQLFADASRRIYGPLPDLDGRTWWMAVASRPWDRDEDPGWGRVDTRTFLRHRPSGEDAPPATPSVATLLQVDADPRAMVPLVWEAFRLDGVCEQYRDFIRRFSPLLDAQPSNLDPESAMAARTLLIHEFRRVVLKDPPLPRDVRPQPWAGVEARRLAAELYRALLPASEAWLSAPDRTPDGPLPSPASSFHLRFSDAPPR